jgi:hypothetical protein
VAKVAFEHLAVYHVVTHSPKRTDAYTSPTTYTNVSVYPDKPEFRVFVKGAHGACLLTGGILTLLTGHWNIATFLFPFNDFDSAPGRVGYSVMLDRANKLAESAPGAFFKIHN